MAVGSAIEDGDGGEVKGAAGPPRAAFLRICATALAYFVPFGLCMRPLPENCDYA